jgi:hypothetical protein
MSRCLTIVTFLFPGAVCSGVMLTAVPIAATLPPRLIMFFRAPGVDKMRGKTWWRVVCRVTTAKGTGRLLKWAGVCFSHPKSLLALPGWCEELNALSLTGRATSRKQRN